MKKEAIKLGIFLVGFLLLAGTVSAFAVSSKYWEENPLHINPGETKEAFVILQNLGGGEDLKVQGFETSTAEGVLISFDDEEPIYDVPLGSKVQVNFTVTVPKDVDFGDLYMVKVAFKTITETESGEFGFGSGVEREIPLLITPKEKKVDSNWWIYLIVAMVVVGLILFFTLRKKKK